MTNWLLIGIIVLVVLVIIGIYNVLVRLNNRVKNAWSQIDVQLKKRYDLVPNLVETVKGYAKHESELFLKVTTARSEAYKSSKISDKIGNNNKFSALVGQMLAVAENYPNLKADQHFLKMQEDLNGIESKIAYARQFYNDVVEQFNTKTQLFPNNLFVKLFGFEKYVFFEAKKEERENVKVKF